MRNYTRILIALCILTLLYSCEKEIAPNRPISEQTVSWKKSGNYIPSSIIYDIVQFENGNIGILDAEDYYLLDSNFNILRTGNLPRLSQYYKPKRITKNIYVHANDAPLFLMYNIDLRNGYISLVSQVLPEKLLNVPDTNFIFGLMDDRPDLPNDGKPIRMFKIKGKAPSDSISLRFSKLDPASTNQISNNSDVNLIGYDRFLTNKNGYLLFSDFSSNTRILSADFSNINPGFRDFGLLTIGATSKYFLLQYNGLAGLQKTTDGNSYTTISNEFRMHKVITDSILVGLFNNLPALYDIYIDKRTDLKTDGLPVEFTKYTERYRFWNVGNKIIWPGLGGVYVYQGTIH